VGKYKVGLDRPDSMEGVAFEVPPVGLIENKGHVVVDIDDEVAKSLKDLAFITVEKSSAAETVPVKYPGYNYLGDTAEEPPPPAPVEVAVETGGGETG
jgi:hypothetical protein